MNFLLLLHLCLSVYGTDHLINKTINTIAFGSCHNIKHVKRYDNTVIWEGISSINPDTFFWLGDTIYPRKKGTAAISDLQERYENMKINKTIGYSDFHPPFGIYGTWDDHDYGGNDRGKEIPQREERKEQFLNFLNISTSDYQREGVYNSIEMGLEGSQQKIKAIFLDTRYHRDYHCIPSVAGYKIPLASVIACLTRWFYSGFDIIPSCRNRHMLGEEQWDWLQHEVQNSDAQVHIIASSIQIFTSAPFFESWSFFPQERIRLLKVLNNTKGLIFLSGDVHLAEITSLFHQQILEVTSSGMTHSCETTFYGSLCPIVLNNYQTHRMDSNAYFTKRNFGSLTLDWEKSSFSVNIHDIVGNIVFSVQRKIGKPFIVTHEQLQSLQGAVNTRFVRPMLICATTVLGLLGFYFTLYYES